MIDARGARPGALIALVAGSVLAVYGRALSVGFFSDDLTWLARLHATRLHPEYLLTFFGRDFTPLFHASLLLDDLVAGPSAWMFHATSALVHAGCAALLVLLLARLGATPAVATCCALAWALNVRISEAVAWPAARCHALATLMVLGALVTLAEPGRERARAACATLLLALALLSKESAIAGVALAPLVVMAREDARAADDRAPEPAWRRLLPLWPLLALAAVFVAFTRLARPGLGLMADPAEALLKIPFLLLRPIGLGDLAPFTWSAFALVMGVIAALALALRHPLVRLGLAWLLVHAAIFAPLEKVSSRYLHALAIGHVLVLAGIVALAARWLGTPRSRRMAAGLGLAALALALAANVVLIQREIDDYRLLAARYERCLDALRPLAREIAPGTTLVLASSASRDEVQDMTRESYESGTIIKLIPDRPGAVRGLVFLAGAINILRRDEDFAVPGPAPSRPGVAPPPAQVFHLDGWRLKRGPPAGGLAAPGWRLDAVHLGSFAEMRDAERAALR